MDKVISRNIHRLRKAKCLERATIASAVGITPDYYGKIESGEVFPNISELSGIASALQVPLRHVVEEVTPLAQVRFRSKDKAHDREQILIDVSRWFYDFCDIEDLLEMKSGYRSKVYEIHDKLPKQNTDPEEAASIARTILGISSTSKINNIRGLLELSGIRVGEFKSPTRDFWGLSIASDNRGHAILINTWEDITVERLIFTAAHELGHLVLHRSDYNSQETDENKNREREADRFASHFLMPHDAFLGEWERSKGKDFYDRVILIKHAFNLSYRAVIYRLAKEFVGKNFWALFNIKYKQRTLKPLTIIEEPLPIARDAFEEFSPVACRRLPFLISRAIEEDKISISRAEEILGQLVIMRSA